MDKPRVAIFDFACCEGCQLQIVNLEEEILALLSIITPVQWREAISDTSETYDIALIEGSVTRVADEQRLKKIRAQATVLVALGSCAALGGINKLKNRFTMQDVKQCVYGDKAALPHLDTYPTKAVSEVVKVDLMIPGCPIDKQEFAAVLKSVALGKTPVIPDYPVCMECKIRENVCRYEYNEICLGPLTRAGCQAQCPSNGFWCFGCRGMVTDPNISAASEIMEKYHRTAADLQSRRALFAGETVVK